MVLLPPVEPMLARAARAVPGPGTLRDPACGQNLTATERSPSPAEPGGWRALA